MALEIKARPAPTSSFGEPAQAWYTLTLSALGEEYALKYGHIFVHKSAHICAHISYVVIH